MDRNQPYCSSGINYWDPAPLGPLEFLNYLYVPDPNYCMWNSGFVRLWNGTAGNYFWNRSH